jgi:hypothetical protein
MSDQEAREKDPILRKLTRMPSPSPEEQQVCDRINRKLVFGQLPTPKDFKELVEAPSRKAW